MVKAGGRRHEEVEDIEAPAADEEVVTEHHAQNAGEEDLVAGKGVDRPSEVVCGCEAEDTGGAEYD